MKIYSYIFGLLISILLVSCASTDNKSDENRADKLASTTFDDVDSDDNSLSENDFFDKEEENFDPSFSSNNEIDIDVINIDPDYEALPGNLEVDTEIVGDDTLLITDKSSKPVTVIKPPQYYSSSRKEFPSGSDGYPENKSSSYSQGTQGSYIVKKGDTLWGISRNFDASVNSIAAANNLNPNSILKVGKSLVIPSGGGKIYSTTSYSSGNSYVVKKGDSYFSIGKQFGISSQELMAYNGAKSSLLKIGQTIRIP